MTLSGTTRAAVLATMLAGSACTETIDLPIQELAIPSFWGPDPGMGRIAILRMRHPPDRAGFDVFNVKLDDDYLVHHGTHLVSLSAGVPQVIDVPIGKHVVELEYAFEPSWREWTVSDLGRGAYGQTAVRIAVDVAAGSYNQVLVHGANNEPKIRVSLDELRGVPDGSYRARVMNLLGGTSDLMVLACPANESCTTIESGLAVGETWEGIVDVPIVAAAIAAGSTQPVPLRPFPFAVLPPRAPTAFLSVYGSFAWPFGPPDPPCPDDAPACSFATVVSSSTMSPYFPGD